MESRRLLASISGNVFYDDNLDGIIGSGENAVAGWNVFADLNHNGTFDGLNSTYDSTDVPLPINDHQTITSSLPIAGNGGTVTNVRVTLNITHTFVGDLRIFLISPAGVRVQLTSSSSNSGHNFTGTTFDDNAATLLPLDSNKAPFTGNFRPVDPLATLAGQNVDGNWQLEVTDLGNKDIGTIDGWTLNVSSGEPSAISSTSGFTLYGAPAGAYSVHLVTQAEYQYSVTSSAVTVDEASSEINGVSFGIRQPPGSVSGKVYIDYDVDGSLDADERGLAGRTVYADLDKDGEFDANEPSTVTNADGVYTFPTLRPGIHEIRTIVPAKWFQTSPAGGGLMGLSSAPAHTTPSANTTKMSYVANQMIIAINSRARLDGALAKLANRKLRDAVPMQRAALLGDIRGETVLFITVKSGYDSAKIAQQFKSLAGVNWAQPNYRYADPTDPRDYTPSDPSYASQYHHTLMQNDLAWDTTEGEGVKVGVTDDGMWLNHPDLIDNLYVNAGEIAGNGIDDDGNGYIDDRNGWDFTNSTTPGTGDNDPSPAFAFEAHGTHVAGILGARTNNGTGVAGVAGRAKIVPLRFYGTGAWTSTVIWNAYKYAVDNGIKIVNTSYNVDGFANDNLYLQAINYLYDNGVLHFNSAGNINQLNPIRQQWDQSLFVSATNAFDVKTFVSNYGTGIDISAPGDQIYSTGINNGYVYMSGTSMATPNAAAVAALIWSAHPTWTRDQVAAQLLGMADNIDAIPANASYANLLGTGRVNSYRAVTQTLGAPTLRNVLGIPVQGGATNVSPTQIRVQFFNVLSAATANNMDNWRLVGAGIDDVFGTVDDIAVPLSLTGTSTTYRIGTNEFIFNINGSLDIGTYRFIASNLTDPFGTSLDGNGDGLGGDAYQREFRLPGGAAQLLSLAPDENKSSINFGQRETIAPTVASSVFQFETGLAIKYVFSEDMTSPTDASIAIVNTTTGQTLPATAYEVSFDHATKTATVTLDHTIASGNFSATLLSNTTADRFGNKLDGDNSGVTGGDHSFSFMFVQGDVTRDGKVDFDDLLRLSQNYGQAGKTFSQGNLNFDVTGNVDFEDLLILAQSYGTALLSASPIVTSTATTSAKKRGRGESVIS